MRRLEGNSRPAARPVGVVITMGRADSAAVPFCDWLCRVPG